MVVGYFTGGAGFAFAEALGFSAEVATTIGGAIGAAAGAAANAAVTGGNIGQAALLGGITGGFLGWLGYQSAIYNPGGSSPIGAGGGAGSAATAVYATDACCIDFGNIARQAGALGSTPGSSVQRMEAAVPRIPRIPRSIPKERPPIPRSPTEPPAPGWEWRGKGPPGSSEGNWYNPKTGESLHPDPGHPPPIGPHYDWRAPDGNWYRIFPDGSIVPKIII